MSSQIHMILHGLKDKFDIETQLSVSYLWEEANSILLTLDQPRVGYGIRSSIVAFLLVYAENQVILDFSVME